MHYPNAAPLAETGVEMATRSLKIVVARSGAFGIAGGMRTAFVVGPRATPIAVRYSGDPDCREWAVPPWMCGALLDVRGGELGGEVADLADLPRAPFRDALLSGHSDLLSVARTALANWAAGRGTADARLAEAVWDVLERDPSLSVRHIADALSVGARRVRQAVRRETGLSTTAIRRLVRHERAVEIIADPHRTLAQAALDAGYADQSHMTREFAALGGITPSGLRAALRPGRTSA